MIEKEFTITNELGLHARPAAMFVKKANMYVADVWVEKDEEQVNGKSIMGLMMLAASFESKILVVTDGEDEVEAMEGLAALIESGFEEDGAS